MNEMEQIKDVLKTMTKEICKSIRVLMSEIEKLDKRIESLEKGNK